MQIYKASIEDINDLIQLRMDFIRIEKGFLSDEDEKSMTVQLQAYFEKHIRLGDFIAIIAKKEGKIASAAFIIIQQRPASPSFMTGVTAMLLNVITYPEYRRKGFSTQVIKALIDEAKAMGASCIDLNAMEDGKLLYQKLGFQISHYPAMRLQL